MARLLVLVLLGFGCLCAGAQDHSTSTAKAKKHNKAKLDAASGEKGRTRREDTSTAKKQKDISEKPNPPKEPFDKAPHDLNPPQSSVVSFTPPAFSLEKPDNSIDSELLWHLLAIAGLFLFLLGGLFLFWNQSRLLIETSFSGTKNLVGQHGASLQSLKEILKNRLASANVEPAPRVVSQPARPSTPQPAPQQPVAQAEPAKDRRSEVIAGYLAVTGASNPEQSLRAFQAKFFFQRISCVNYEDFRVDQNTQLRFAGDQHGNLLLVNDQNDIYAFPWFFSDLTSSRDRIRGIFKSPPESRKLRLAFPAQLTEQLGEWVLLKPGVLESDG